jgi:hypothetical protein
MERDQRIVSVLSRISAVVSFLGGVAILGFLLLLTMLWPTRSFFGELLALLCDPAAIALFLCAIAAMVLAPFIWRERIWAMLATLALSGGLLFMFGNETLFLKISLSGMTALFAICAAAHHWLARPAPR